MKKLSKHILIYDKDCPLCSAYTRLFVYAGLLHAGGRQAYQDMDFTNTPVDTVLARNKIALLNTQTQKVDYGLDAMIKILGNKFPLIPFCMRCLPLYWAMTQLYSLISYNRKIIIPVSCNGLSSCNPTRNRFWRSVFLLICCLPVQLALPSFFRRYFTDYYSDLIPFGETLLYFAQLAFQYAVCRLIKEKNIYDYLGHVAFVSFLGAVMIAVSNVLFSVAAQTGMQTAMPAVVSYGIIIGWMLMEHHRRVRLLGMSSILTLSWVLFRLLVYPFVFALR